jgi:hypothetical protein
LNYPNVSKVLGAVISTGMASLHELQTIYSLQDVFDLLEIAAINGHNRKMMMERE